MDPNQQAYYPPQQPQGYPAQGYPNPQAYPPCSTSKHLHHHSKKRRATDVYTHVSLHSAAAGSAARPASVVLSASTVAVNPHQQTTTI